MGGRDRATRDRQVCALDNLYIASLRRAPHLLGDVANESDLRAISSGEPSGRRALAHCSSSDSVLPCAVEAKPHLETERRLNGVDALGRDGELLERSVLGRLVNAGDHRVLVLELASLARNDAEDDGLRASAALGQEAQGSEVT